MVDAVASLGCVPFEMDAWGVDVAMAGSQKGLMTPPGLGFVAAGPRARHAHRQANLRSPYWDWTMRDGELHYQKYAGTPPEHLLFALRAALDLIFAEGLDNVFHRHRLLAEATRRAVGTWAEGQSIGFNVSERSSGSDTLKPIDCPSAQVPTARRVASASRRWRANTFSSPSAKIRSSAARRPNSRCSGGVPQYMW